MKYILFSVIQLLSSGSSTAAVSQEHVTVGSLAICQQMAEQMVPKPTSNTSFSRTREEEVHLPSVFYSRTQTVSCFPADD